MKIGLCANFGQRCGVAEYSRYLHDALRQFATVARFRYPSLARGCDVVHIQHEFALFPATRLHYPRDAKAKAVTWHTVLDKAKIEHGLLAAFANVQIVHTELQKTILKKRFRRPLNVVPHGSIIFNVKKKDAQTQLKLPSKSKVIFAFGFAANAGPGYNALVDAMREVVKKYPNALLILAASPHFRDSGQPHVNEVKRAIRGTILKNKVLVIQKFLTDPEINRYASAADVLLFNYHGDPRCYSVSGALHRVAAAGRPVIYSREDHRFSELTDGVHGLAIQTGNASDISDKIMRILGNKDLSNILGQKIRLFAEASSWENAAKRHIQLYRQHG